MTKICKICRLKQPDHKISCKDFNKEYVIPTAEEFLKYYCEYDSITGFYSLVDQNDLIEFTNLHLDNAIKEYSEYLFKCSIDKEYPLTYIDWLKNYKTKNKLI